MRSSVLFGAISFISSLICRHPLMADSCNPCADVCTYETAPCLQTQMMVLPPVYQYETCYGHPIFDAKFIFWTTRQEGMEYAIQGASVTIRTDSPPPPIKKGPLQQLDWEWNPGFKAGLGWNLPHDGWDVFARYTWLQTNPTASYASESFMSYSLGNAAFDFFFNFYEGIQFPFESSADWKCQFHSLDLELGRDLYLSQLLTFRPFFGLKGAGIFDKYKVVYVLKTNELTIYRNNDYWAIGMRVGSDTVWHFNNNWGIFGNISASAMWTYMNVSRQDVQTIGVMSQNIMNTKEQIRTLNPVLEMTIGISYETIFWETSRFSMKTGWEAQLWGAHNNFVEASTAGPIGSLMLQGLTASFRLDY